MSVTETARRYTPQEAAALSGVRLQRVQNAITDRQFGRAFAASADGRRHIDLPALLTIAALDRLGKVRIEPATLYRALRKSGPSTGPIPVTETVTLDGSRLLGPVLHKLRLYESIADRIVSDPAIMGGLPVIKGTRIPARMIHARVAGGETVEAILEDYPYLDRDMVEAAVLFAEANPVRGRPARRLTAKDD